jgi:hypothetical protein
MAAAGMSRFAVRIAANQVHARDTAGCLALGERKEPRPTPRRRTSETTVPLAPLSTVGRAAEAANDTTRSIARRSTKLATAPRKNAVAVATFGTVGARSQGEPQRDRRMIPVRPGCWTGLPQALRPPWLHSPILRRRTRRCLWAVRPRRNGRRAQREVALVGSRSACENRSTRRRSSARSSPPGSRTRLDRLATLATCRP